MTEGGPSGHFLVRALAPGSVMKVRSHLSFRGRTAVIIRAYLGKDRSSANRNAPGFFVRPPHVNGPAAQRPLEPPYFRNRSIPDPWLRAVVPSSEPNDNLHGPTGAFQR